MSFPYGFNILFIASMRKIGILSPLLAGPGILSLALKKFGKGRKIQGGFTCVHQTRKDEYAIDPRMSQFKLTLFDKTGRRKFTTTPFNHDVWWSFVHENATVMFVESKQAAFTLSVIMQYAGIVDSEPKYWPYTGEATEFHHADNGLTLFEYGRWRSQDTLDWVLHHDYDGVPDSIKEEIRDLCNKYAAKDPSSFQPKARQPTPPPASRASGSYQEPRRTAQRPAPPAPPKRAPPAPPVPLNPDISRGDAIKESVEKALAFQRPDPAAMRAALHNQLGGSALRLPLQRPKCRMQDQSVFILCDKRRYNLLVLSAALTRLPLHLLEHLTRP